MEIEEIFNMLEKLKVGSKLYGYYIRHDGKEKNLVKIKKCDNKTFEITEPEEIWHTDINILSQIIRNGSIVFIDKQTFEKEKKNYVWDPIPAWLLYGDGGDDD